VDAALGLKEGNQRLFTFSMLLESRSGEVVVCIVRILTTEKIYVNHTINFLHLEPNLKRDSGLYSIRLDDKDGEHLAIHCHDHHNGASQLFLIKLTNGIEYPQNGTALFFLQYKVIVDFQWLSFNQSKYLFYITRHLDVYIIDPEGGFILIYFQQEFKTFISLLNIFRRRLMEYPTIQLFNVNTEVLFLIFILSVTIIRAI